MKRGFGPKPNYPHVLEYKRNPQDMITIAGPCSIESVQQITLIAQALKEAGGVTFMRGGVFRAGTYPPKDYGLQVDLLETWAEIAHRYGHKIIVEVVDLRDIELIDRYADAFQVGARQGQGYALLKEISKTDKTVTLKRGTGMTVDEFLGAAEYLLEGNCKPILIERGSVSYHNHVRWDLSVSVIAAIKCETNLPIIVDASHGSGRRDLVWRLTMAGLGAGADGFLVEVHPEPDKSLSDSEQAFPLEEFKEVKNEAHAFWALGPTRYFPIMAG